MSAGQCTNNNQEFESFINEAYELICSRKKMTNPLYQTILAGEATKTLLQQMVIHRFPIKNFWTRNILGIASRIDDYKLRRLLVENIYEEETGGLTKSDRHLNTFIDFGKCLGLSEEDIINGPVEQETQAVIDHNVSVCNDLNHHFTEGMLSVLFLMEGQPAIVNKSNQSMEAVMRDKYCLPQHGYEYFTHHASGTGDDRVSELEDEHAQAAIDVLQKYCNTNELRNNGMDALKRAIELRHNHFTMIYERFYNENEKPYRYGE